MKYLYVNLLWYAFLGVVIHRMFLLTGRVWDDDMANAVGFVFLVLGGGFTIASVLHRKGILFPKLSFRGKV